MAETTGQTREPAATLEEDDQHRSTSVPPKGFTPRVGVMKFAHASGARPLDGYTIKRGIGIGGFGEVYFATSDAGKEVALKRIQRNLEIEVRGVSQCLNLKHINLIGLHDIKYDEYGEGWVVMEYVTGESLKDVLERNPNGLPLEDVDRWFKEIAAGVGYLHEHGIVHRDLKPGNIFTDEGTVKIGDYGLSKFISCSRRSGQTESVGTFHYMAPEIGKGVYGKEIDIYALGIILFEMLTGRVPFEGESSQEIIMKHLTADPDLDCITEPYRETIRRALLKDPEKRFSSVSQMLAGLELGETTSIVDSRPIPDVRVPVTVVDDEPLYITDDEEDDEGDMFFGPVQEVFSEATTPETSIGAFPSEPAAACTRGRPSSAAISEEPIARAVKKGASKAKQWWRDSNLSNPVKFLLLLAGVIVLVFNSEILVPLSLTFVAAYLIYLGIRWIVIGMNRSGERREAQPLVRRYGDWKQRARLAVHHKSPAEKASDLTGAMLLSAIISMSLCFVLLLLNGISFETVPGWSSFTWLSLTAVAGVWTLLAAGKFWERTDGEGVRRRFLMLIAGLAIGALAYSTSRLLLVPQNYLTVDLRDSLASPGMYDNQIPSLAAYLCFFAGLFFLVRWWKQVDPLRNSRLSVWATAMSVVWALVLHTFIPFPHPWILPLVISVSAQLSAPWVNEKEKKQFRQSVQEVV